MTSIDYKKVFSKLSHIKALSHDQKFEQVVQNLIIYSIFNSSVPIHTEAELTDAINHVYGISVRLHVIQSNLDKLLDGGSILRDRQSKHLLLPPVISENIRQRLEGNIALDEKVKNKWLYEIAQTIPEISSDRYEALWHNLNDYLYAVFEQHGVETLILLNPSKHASADDQKSLMAILDKVIKDNHEEFSKEHLAAAINQFILKADEQRTDYISQLVDATFTSFALTSDADTVNFLNNRFNNLLLFLDTNFIFGILDLHKNNEDASAREILTEIKKNNFPFHLTYHPETLSEFKRAFDAKALIIRATKWSRETSRLALVVDGLSPLEELYHKENIKDNIDPDVFLDKYNHVDLIIKDLGLVEHSLSKSTQYEAAELEEDIAEYQKFYEAIKHRKPKTYQGFKHDIEVLREVRSLNRKKSKFLESKAFFISSDYILSKFEKEYYKKRWEINFIISPSTFLQLIRPFIQNDYTTNKKFIDTFSIPDLRTFEIDYTTTRSKTLQILNDAYHDTSFETKVNILRDQVLLEKFESLRSNQQAQVELIENKIAAENLILSQKKAEAETKVEIFTQEIESLESSKQQVEKEAHQKEIQIDQLKSELDEVRNMLKQEQQEKIYTTAMLTWEKNKGEFIKTQYTQELIAFKNDLKYCIRPLLSVVFFAFVVFILSRFYNELLLFFVPVYIPKWVFMVGVIAVGLGASFELAFRSYIVDKDRVKRGLRYGTTFGLKGKKAKLMSPLLIEIEKKFIVQSPVPQRQKIIDTE